MSSKVRIQLMVMMFFQFFVWGSYLVPMWKWLLAMGFSGDQIGLIYATNGIAAIVSPFFVGMIADRFFATEKVLGVLHILSGAFLFACTAIRDPWLFFAALLAHSLCYMPTLALVNSISFHQMKDPSKEFPAIRVLGTIGWIVVGVIVGIVLPKALSQGDVGNTPLPFHLGGAVGIALGLYCFTLPHTPPKGAKEHVTVSDVLGLKALGLMKQLPFAIFIFCSFLICIPLAFYYQSANGFIGKVGIANTEFKMTFGQMSEIFFMLVMPMFFAWLGVRYMLLVGMLAWVTRYFLFTFGVADTATAHLMLYAGIILHGICYDFFFVTGQIYVDKKAPEEIRANAQGFLALITYGAGMVIGALINGRVASAYMSRETVGPLTDAHKALGDGGLVEKVIENGTVIEKVVNLSDGVLVQITTNWKMIWIIPAVMALIVTIAFALLFRDRINSEEAKEEAQTAESGTG